MRESKQKCVSFAVIVGNLEGLLNVLDYYKSTKFFNTILLSSIQFKVASLWCFIISFIIANILQVPPSHLSILIF